MERPARISLSGNSRNQEETVELFTVGKVVTEPNLTAIEYEEEDGSGNKLKTSICITGEVVTVNKFFGENVTTMVFEAGKVFASALMTPYGTVDTEILAESVSVEHTEQAIRIALVYRICVENGELLNDSRLEIECLFE